MQVKSGKISVLGAMTIISISSTAPPEPTVPPVQGSEGGNLGAGAIAGIIIGILVLLGAHALMRAPT